MSHEGHDLDAYLDGTLSADEADAFRVEVEADSELAETVALQEAIDASLRRSFAVPDLSAIHQRVEEAVQVVVSVDAAAQVDQKVVGRPWYGIAIAAAVVLVSLLGLWVVYSATTEEPSGAIAVRPADGPVQPLKPPLATTNVTSRWVDLYQTLPAGGFADDSDCTAPPPQALSCAADGTSALVLQTTPQLRLRSECGELLPCTQFGVRAARIMELGVGPEDTRVLVFVVVAGEDPEPEPELAVGSEFFLHRRALGHVVLYELSPLAKPSSLAAFAF